MYAITIKQNINTAVFGFVKKQTCISKTLHAHFKAPPKTIQIEYKVDLSHQIMDRELAILVVALDFVT